MRIERIGVCAMFLIPSIKVYSKKYSKSRQSVSKTIHNFLNDTFGGYTCASGNIYGYFTSEAVEYDELREFRVAYDGKFASLTKLKEFLAKLAEDIDEECIYLQSGSEAFLVYP